LLVLYDASGNHDDAYFRNLRRLVRVNYAKSTRIHAHIAQSTDNKPRCPSKFRCKVLRAIGSRLEESRFFRYTPDRRFEKCTGQFDAYYLDSTTLAKVNRDVARVSDDYPGTMLMLRRMSDLRHVLDIANNNAPESRLETLFKTLLINYHLKSMSVTRQFQPGRRDATTHFQRRQVQCHYIQQPATPRLHLEPFR
jgi:hypothetical protein